MVFATLAVIGFDHREDEKLAENLGHFLKRNRLVSVH